MFAGAGDWGGGWPGAAREIRPLRSDDDEMTPVISNESELYVAPGGPIDRLTHRIAIVRYGCQSAPRRIIGLLFVTWVPMCVLALLQGNALGATPRESFLLDFATYVRF